MVRLKNIQIDRTTASADFYPETSEIGGHIVVDLKSGEFISLAIMPGYEYEHGMHYPGHAARQLMRMAETNDQRTECYTMWY